MNPGITALPLLLFSFGPMEVTVLAVLAVILFGRRLPEVGRSLGRGIVEFKKGLRGISDDVNQTPAQQIEPPKAPDATLPPPQDAPRANP
jgi:sec-independent protein translocase protein TatA